MLIVLDNASDAAQVRPLLPGPGSCLVVVTSPAPDRLGLAATDGAHLLTLDVLSESRGIVARWPPRWLELRPGLGERAWGAGGARRATSADACRWR